MSQLIQTFKSHHKDYLKDESRLSGKAQSISFPESEAQVRQIIKTLFKKQTPVTIQGSRTGITGAAVPLKGHLLNLSAMTKITGMEQDSSGRFSIMAQPGLCLSELNRQLASGSFDTSLWSKNSLEILTIFKKSLKQFWPPDPTEISASIGGIAASNARGISAHYYGAAGKHIKGIRLIDAKGDVNIITRKNESMLDLFLGSEGMLGAMTEINLALLPLPEEQWGIVFFFKEQPEILEFASLEFIKAATDRFQDYPNTDIVSMEFMDHTTLKCIEKLKKNNSRFKQLPDIQPDCTSAVYIEIHSSNSVEIDSFLNALMKTAIEFECDPESSWAFCGFTEIGRIRLLRHAAPESVNMLIDKARQKDSRIRKLGTDMQNPSCSNIDMIKMYRSDLYEEKLKATIFGHAADCHLHVNILPEDFSEFKRAKALTEKWAVKVASRKGSVVTEHGIGKIKKHLFKNLPLPQQHSSIISKKKKLDPKGLWNPGNMFDTMQLKSATGSN